MTLPRTLLRTFKKLEDDDEIFDVHDRFATRLLDLGFIEFFNWRERIPGGSMGLSGYKLTEKGKIEFQSWRDSLL